MAVGGGGERGELPKSVDGAWSVGFSRKSFMFAFAYRLSSGSGCRLSVHPADPSGALVVWHVLRSSEPAAPK